MSKDLLKYIIANLIFLGFVHDSLPGVANGVAINGSLWTIKIEVAFYILLPLIIMMCNKMMKNKKNNHTIDIVLVTICIADIILSHIVLMLVKKYGLPHSFSTQIQWHLPLFITGMSGLGNFLT